MTRTATQIVIQAAAAAGLAVTMFFGSTGTALAQSADQVKAEFARAVYKNSGAKVHDDRPQPLLRAVVVLRIRLSAQNQWQAEVFRDNPQ